MKITVVGAGYVGLSLSALLSQFHEVTCLDIDDIKVEKINKRTPPLDDADLINIFNDSNILLNATSNKEIAYKSADLVIISTPTNYDMSTNQFDVSSIENVITDILKINNKIPVFIKSTVPVGFTLKLRKNTKKENIFFSPEFLREGKAIYDNQYPSRIIVGGNTVEAKKFADILLEVSLIKADKVPVEFMDSAEAEAVKLFSNTYLAMRIAYFNELDTYCEMHNLDSKKIIKGIGYDPRIGNYYNNPSFGYGGYCLPKDSKQLLQNYENVPNNIIRAIVEANTTRKDFISSQIIKKNPKVVGIYRLVMKEGSDNYRESSILGVMRRIKSSGIKVIIYEPNLLKDIFLESKVFFDLDEFIQNSDLIIANRNSPDLQHVSEKIYTRDLFQTNWFN